MEVERVIRQVDVVGSSRGMDQVARAYGQVADQSDRTTKSLKDSNSEAARAAAAADSLGRQLQDQLRMQQQYTDAMRQQTMAMASIGAANDNARKSFTVMGLEVATAANHLRVGAEAAYAFSPAFRGVVNGMAAPALRGASVALVAVAGGIVTATNLAGTGLVRLGASAALASTSLTPVAGVITSAGLAMQAFNPSIAGVATSILSKFLPALRLLGTVGLIVNAAKMVGDAWELGGQQLERYRQIAEDAAKVDLSTTYFQKLTKGAEAAKLPVDALTAALTTLQKQSADQLGGSPLQNRLAASVKVGNFAGNTGVQEFAEANTTQQRYEAIVSLIHQAMEAGQRLAALDIAGTAFGPEAADNLRKDSEYFDKLTAAAAKISDAQLVSPEDVGRALDLQTRYDAAVKILETRWHPIQDLLTQAGIEFHANWVATVETIAQAFDWTANMVAKLGDVPSWFQKKLNEGGQWIIDNTTTPESRKAAETSYDISSQPAEMAKGTDAYAVAVNKLRAGLQDQAEQQRKVAEANTIAQKALGDTSHQIDSLKKKTEEANDAYDRALESVTKHTARMQADTLAVGLGAGALEEYRARSQLTTAAQLAGREPTSALTAEIEKQAKAAGEAGRALALARAQSQANFTTKTLFMSQEDIAAANVMKNIYGDDWQAHMDDALAKQTKMNAQLGEARDAAQQFATSFVQGLLSGKSGMDALVASADQLASKLADKGVQDLFSGNFVQGGLELGASALISVFTGDQKAKKQLEEAQDTWKKAGPAFQKFLTEMTGGTQGNLAAMFEQQFQTAYDLAVQADKAHDFAAVTQIYTTLAESYRRASRSFLATFNSTLQGLMGGMGLNSPFLTAIGTVKTQLTQMQAFVDDARVSIGDLNGAIEPTTGQLRPGAGQAQIDQINDYTNRATAAAENYLLSLLQSAPALSTVQTALQNLDGTASALQGALVQLGMSSESAAAAISNGVGKALDAIKAQFDASLTERLNTANGKGYLNEATALLKQHAQDLADASALGLDPALVNAVFHAEAQKIIEDAGLVGDSFSTFIDLFPDFSNVVTAATAQLTASIKTINDYLDSLKVGDKSTLSPQEKLNEAQSQFNAQLTLAQKGNADAMGTITQYASTLLDQAKAFYASSAGYGDVYSAVTEALKGLTGATGMALGGVVPGYAGGGVVGNGTFGVDSVIARYAGGGSIGLAGGEFVMPAVQTQKHLPMLEAMRSGSASNDNGRYFDSLGQQVVRALASCAMGQIAAIREEGAALRADIRKLTAAVEANRPKAPRPAARGVAA